MSKKSRRRARQARERREVRIVPLTWSARPSDFVATMARVVASLPAAFGHVADTFDRFNLSLTSIGGGWPAAVMDAFRRNDSLPLLVYADWCEENGRPDHGSLARRVAAKMQGVANS